MSPLTLHCTYHNIKYQVESMASSLQRQVDTFCIGVFPPCLLLSSLLSYKAKYLGDLDSKRYEGNRHGWNGYQERIYAVATENQEKIHLQTEVRVRGREICDQDTTILCI